MENREGRGILQKGADYIAISTLLQCNQASFTR